MSYLQVNNVSILATSAPSSSLQCLVTPRAYGARFVTVAGR